MIDCAIFMDVCFIGRLGECVDIAALGSLSLLPVQCLSAFYECCDDPPLSVHVLYPTLDIVDLQSLKL